MTLRSPRWIGASLLGLGLVVAVPSVSSAARVKVRPTVPFARSWDAAVDEARLLNVPIVLHVHGFG